jgi:hypothetical protein
MCNRRKISLIKVCCVRLSRRQGIFIDGDWCADGITIMLASVDVQMENIFLVPSHAKREEY